MFAREPPPSPAQETSSPPAPARSRSISNVSRRRWSASIALGLVAPPAPEEAQDPADEAHQSQERTQDAIDR